MFVLRTLVWDQIKLPDDWLLKKLVPAVRKEQSKLDTIITNFEGDVSIRFQRGIQRSSSYRLEPVQVQINPSRHSCSSSSPSKLSNVNFEPKIP